MLTARETEVLSWVVNGLTNPEIAKVLGITIHTVKHHLDSISKKLRTRKRLCIAVAAVRGGLV
jgi:DNA-binding CsgD family transcriptional regulator